MIRKAKVNDIFKIAQIEKDVFGSTLGVDFLYNDISANEISHYFVYTINFEIIGYIGIRIYDGNAEVMNFVVNNQHQNKGYGQALFTYFEKYSKNYNVKIITLEVRNSNKKAIRFYMKNGYIKSHIRKNYYINEDAVVYIKEVK